MGRLQLGTSLNNLDLTKVEKKVLSDYFEVITVENDFKWPNLEYCQNKINFDVINDYSKSLSNYTIKGHAFFWPEYLPIWTKTLNSAEIFEAVSNCIKSTFLYIASNNLINIKYWDISNEILSSSNPYLSVEDIFKLFQIGKQTNPSIKLCLNEIIDSEEKVKNFKKIIIKNTQLETPIDVYGFQIHTNTQNLEIVNFTKKAIELVKSLDANAEIHISEVDVSKIKSKDKIEQANKQASIYDSILDLAKSYDCKILTLWGLNDKRSWISNNEKAQSLYEATLINENGKPKKKFFDLLTKLQ